MTFPSLKFAQVDDRREDSIRTMEKHFNVEFNGFQESGTGYYYLTLTDRITSSTFLVIDLRDIPKRLKEIRGKFKCT